MTDEPCPEVEGWDSGSGEGGAGGGVPDSRLLVWRPGKVVVGGASPLGMVTCELLRVRCWLSRRQHNRQHAQVTRVKEKLVKSRKRPSAPLAKEVCGNSLKSDL